MKRFAIRVILHILFIMLLSIGSCLLFQKQLWFSTVICIILLITFGIHLYRMQFKQIILLRRLTDGLRYNDMMQTFHPPFKNKIMNEWAKELSESLKDFRGRLLAEEIKHQYYENLLNKDRYSRTCYRQSRTYRMDESGGRYPLRTNITIAGNIAESFCCP